MKKLSLLVLLLLPILATPVCAQTCDPQEAGNLLWQMSEKDPAFHSFVAQLAQWGYVAETTCVVEKTPEPDQVHVRYVIEQQLSVQKRPGRVGIPALRPPYLMRTHLSYDPQAQSASLREFSVSRK